MKRDCTAASNLLRRTTKNVPGSDVPGNAVVLDFAFFILGCRGAVIFDILLRVAGACCFWRGVSRSALDFSLGRDFPKSFLHLGGLSSQGAGCDENAEYRDISFHQSFSSFSRYC